MEDDDERRKVECPICGEFVAAPESVRNHITGKQDDDHNGEDGVQYLAELEEKAYNSKLDEDPFAGEPATKSEQATEPGEPATKPEAGEIKKAQKIETEDGEGGGYSFVIVGGLGLLLWMMAKGGQRAENQVQPSQPGELS